MRKLWPRKRSKTLRKKSQPLKTPFGKTQPQGFNFTQQMRLLCADMVRSLAQLQHIDLDRVAISFSQALKRVDHGFHASITPMRFEGGSLTSLRKGRKYRVERLYDQQNREMLYILSFYLPRFMDVDFHEKLVTIFHELWHISPQFDGDLRRHPGRYYAHSHSEAQYDAEMALLAKEYLALNPPETLLSFLRESYDQLHARTGRIYGMKISRPKLIALD